MNPDNTFDSSDELADGVKKEWMTPEVREQSINHLTEGKFTAGSEFSVSTGPSS